MIIAAAVHSQLIELTMMQIANRSKLHFQKNKLQGFELQS